MAKSKAGELASCSFVRSVVNFASLPTFAGAAREHVVARCAVDHGAAADRDGLIVELQELDIGQGVDATRPAMGHGGAITNSTTPRNLMHSASGELLTDDRAIGRPFRYGGERLGHGAQHQPAVGAGATVASVGAAVALRVDQGVSTLFVYLLTQQHQRILVFPILRREAIMPIEPSSLQRWTTFNRMAVVNALAKWAGARSADARGYNLLFVAVVLPPVLIMLVLALTQEPLRGDLTRPGGYTESEYGWNQPQERFAPPVVSMRYDRPFDVVVLGDSFSSNVGGQTDPGAFWTNFFAQRTGLSTVVVARFDMTLADLLRHPVFLRTPPQLLILETVERYLIRDFVLEADRRVGRFGRHCGVKTHRLPDLPAFHPLTAKPVPWVRDARPEVNFDQAANFLWKAVWRNVLGHDITRVVRLALTRPDLFSSRTADQLLVYDDELRKVQFTTTEALDQAYCTLLDAQNHVQSNGHTRFLFMAAPDKATAYADYLADAGLRQISPLPEFYKRAGLSQVALVEHFRQAIRCGSKDIYMPNDTHWSSASHRIVADAVVDALTGARGRPDC